jgi:phosphatidylethanolamine/phosphatidyl-N-methylethanolamine N-methyltransferase
METPNVDSAATEHTRSRYNLVAPLYDLLERPVERGRFRAWRSDLWERVGTQTPGNETRVLELGVGTGKNIPFYPERVRVTAVDLSEAMLHRARRTARQYPEKRVDLYEMDIQQLDFEDQTFDVVVATFVFCSVPDPVRGLREALRVVRRRGRLLLLEHMIATKAVVARPMRWFDPLVHWVTGVHIARATVRNVERAGWKIDEVTPLSRFDIFRRIEAQRPDAP